MVNQRGDGVTAARLPDQAAGDGSIPISPLFDKHAWEVRPCSLSLVQELVKRHHYARGGSRTAVYTQGLFPVGAVWDVDCKGVAWWLPPTRNNAVKRYPKNPNGVLTLTRLVIVPGVLTNACSFLIRHAMRFIDRRRWPYLLTYADEWQGHKGVIYRAAGWTEDGFTKAHPVYVRDGMVISRKSAAKTRTHGQMLAMGCECVGKFRKKRFFHLQDNG